MKSFISLSALVAVVAANAVTAPTGDFTLGVWNPRNNWTGKKVSANGGAFFVGKETKSSCPTINGLDCSAFPGTTTVLSGGNGTVHMAVAVPGGQQVFVAPNGALGYTPPHTTSMPKGSLVEGFNRYQSQSGGAPIPIDFQNKSFKACPVAKEAGVYQIFAAAVGETAPDCVSVQLRTYGAALSAWQY